MSHARVAAWSWLAAVLGCLFVGGCATLSDASATNPLTGGAIGAEGDPEQSDGLTWDDLSLDNLGKAARKAVGRGPNRDVAIELYRQADTQYRQAAALEGPARIPLFAAAGPKFAEASERWPDSALAMDALFMAGESMFFADDYPQANDYYEQLVKAFPNNRYLDVVDQRRFSIAKYWLDINRENPEEFYYVNFTDKTRPWKDARGYGLRVFDKIRVDDPTGKLTDDATLAAANEHFSRGRFLKADEYYTDLRTAYPASEHQFLAHFLGLKAKMNSYGGPSYSGASLDEGEKLIKQMRRQFPQESLQEREFLDRAAAEIRLQKAQRLAYLADHYDSRAEYRAATHYYARIAQEYSDTPLAARAQERVGAIAGLPPVPPQQAQWLVNLFPESDDVKPLLAATQRERQSEEAIARQQNELGETVQR